MEYNNVCHPGHVVILLTKSLLYLSPNSYILTVNEMTDFFETTVENLEPKRRQEKIFYSCQEIQGQEIHQEKEKNRLHLPNHFYIPVKKICLFQKNIWTNAHQSLKKLFRSKQIFFTIM